VTVPYGLDARCEPLGPDVRAVAKAWAPFRRQISGEDPTTRLSNAEALKAFSSPQPPGVCDRRVMRYGA
jgi:hypothetical protein